MRKERMGIGKGLHLLLLLAMVATNILSLYHLLSSVRSPPPPSSLAAAADVPDHLLRQLRTIRATISHLTHLHSSGDSSSSAGNSPPPELLLYSRLAPIASACADHPDLLRQFMTYTPFAPCPAASLAAAEPLLLRGCHPLPRRRCFHPTPPKPLLPKTQIPDPLPDAAVLWPPAAKCRSFSCLPPHLGFNPRIEASRLLRAESALDLPLPQLLRLAKSSGAWPLRLGLDVGGGTGTLAVHLRQMANATIVTTTMDLGAPYSEAAALRGVVPLHAPLQARFPVGDGTLDLVRTGHAVNRWIPSPAMEFLFYDVDRVLRAGGLFWVDHFFCRAEDLESVYAPMIGKLSYKIIKWAVGNKTGAGGVKYGEVYLTALLQKPMPATSTAAAAA